MKTYECSTRGDKRFSALCARLPDGRTIEEHYQCDIKGYDPGGRNWRLGKGKPPLNQATDTRREYRALWYRYLKAQPELAKELKLIMHDHVLTDCFSKPGSINQADTLTWLVSQGHV